MNIEDTSSPQPTPEASFDSNATTNSILDPNKKINSSDKNTSKNIESGGRAALADGTKAISSHKGEILGCAVEALTKYTLFVIDKP